MIEWITANFSSVIEIALGVVGVFSLIATLTPNTSDDKIVGYLLKAINFLGANFGKAANKEE